MSEMAELAALIEKVSATVRKEMSAEDVREASAEIFDVVAFLNQAALGFASGKPAPEFELSRLARKIEISRSLRAYYRGNKLALVPQARPLSHSEVFLVLLLFLAAYAQTSDLRYLNTVLKAEDPGLLLPAEFEFPAEVGQLATEALGV